MRDAFSLIELIFVIVIIGILAGVASTTFRVNYLREDAQAVVIKIRQAQYKGLGYTHGTFSEATIAADYEHGCIRLEKNAMEEKAAEGQNAHRLHVDAFDEGTLCFDEYGRPYETDLSPSNHITSIKVLTLSLNGQNQDIIIYPKSGFATVKCE